MGRPDGEARRREATSVGLTTALLAGLVGLQLGVAAFLVAEVAEPEVETAQLVLIEPASEAPLEAAPAPPAPPPPAGGGRSEPIADDAPVEPAPLDPEPEPQVADPREPSGPGTAEGGDPNGRKGGVPGGVPNGVPDGTGDGDGGAVRAFHHSELKRTRVVDPEYPKGAKELNLGSVSCRVHVFLDEDGAPYDVRVESCPTPFHEETKRAMYRSRWVPPRLDGEPVKARTLIVIRYTLR